MSINFDGMHIVYRTMRNLREHRMSIISEPEDAAKRLHKAGLIDGYSVRDGLLCIAYKNEDEHDGNPTVTERWLTWEYFIDENQRATKLLGYDPLCNFDNAITLAANEEYNRYLADQQKAEYTKAYNAHINPTMREALNAFALPLHENLK